MAIRDRIKTEELEEMGFKIIAENKAKHERYNSYRHKCPRCGDWVKQTLNYLCLRCSRKR